jgi:hypothetical protein
MILNGHCSVGKWHVINAIPFMKSGYKTMAKKKSSLLSSGKTGTSTGSMEYSKAYSKKRYKRMMKEEKMWQSLNGPITVRKIDNA